MEKEYQLVRVISRKNREGKYYYLALVLFNRQDDSDLLRILVKESQAEALQDLDDDDISDLVKIDYNSYQKCYQPKINI